MERTYEEHSKEVQALLNKGDISRRSMLTSEQIFNCYRLLDSDEWEVMSPNAIRNAVMGAGSIPTDTEPDEWNCIELDRGTGCVCPSCNGKLIVNWEELDDAEDMLCPYCFTRSTLPEEPDGD